MSGIGGEVLYRWLDIKSPDDLNKLIEELPDDYNPPEVSAQLKGHDRGDTKQKGWIDFKDRTLEAIGDFRLNLTYRA